MSNARKSDPITSHLASKSSEQRTAIINRVVCIVKANPGLIVDEILDKYNEEHNADFVRENIQKRVSDAANKSLIRKDTNNLKVNRKTGKSCYTLWPIEQKQEKAA